MATLTTENIVNGLLRFNGSDVGKFLQGQLTCDINELQPGRALPGVFCTPQGRVRASFIMVMVDDDDYLMILPVQQISFLIDAMAPYIAFFQSTMSDVSSDWHVFGLQLSQEEVTPLSQNLIQDLPELLSETWQVSISDSVLAIKLPGKSHRWHCLSRQSQADSVNNLPETASLQWQIQDMKSGMVWIDETNRDKFLPHDLSLPSFGAVSFNKGCYTGQEIVARMQYRGTPKYLLAILETQPTDAEIPDKLVQLIDNSGQLKIGEVISKLHLSDNSWLICASVKRLLLNTQQFQLSSEQEAILCTLTIPE